MHAVFEFSYSAKMGIMMIFDWLTTAQINDLLIDESFLVGTENTLNNKKIKLNLR